MPDVLRKRLVRDRTRRKSGAHATLARSFGVYGEGPITNPNDLGPALQRAVARVEKGETALVDVVTQPR